MSGTTVRPVLTDDAFAALFRMAGFEETSKTNIISRALVLYEMIVTAEPGNMITFPDSAGDDREVVAQR